MVQHLLQPYQYQKLLRKGINNSSAEVTLHLVQCEYEK